MAALLSILDVSFSRGSNTLFEHISLTINHGDRIGFVGHNGSGKSTLLSLLMGTEEPDNGEIHMPRGQRVALVEQFVPKELLDLTLVQAVLNVIATDQQQENRYRADELLQQLGFSVTQTELPLASLSGGQQNLALLARAILLQPELLLMDEPGNHMDAMALVYLQRFLLRDRSVPFLLISHDRELLNVCCERTVFLRDKTLYSFDCSYDEAAEALARHDFQAATARQAEEKEIKRLQASAKRLAVWGKNYDNEDLARKAKSMQKRVERLKETQTIVSSGSGLDLQIHTDALRTKSLCTLENLDIFTPDGLHELLNIDFQYVRPGDRIALLGRNGVGKSTTINRLVSAIGKIDEQVRFNPNVKLGYYDQELQQFKSTCSRFDWLRDRCEVSDDKIKQVLLKNGIPHSDFDRQVNGLSGGECARLMFMVFQLNKPNFLVLDEPTNHIDIQGREQLEQQLIDSNATLLITSHDRRFVEHVANRWWCIVDKKVVELNGLEEFYNTVVADISPGVSEKVQAVKPGNDVITDLPDEETKLARIEELESLLKNDRARKKKFQKPKRQAEWNDELNRLWAELD